MIVNLLNKITSNQYENNQDRIYDVAETLLNSFKENEGNESECLQSCLQVFGINFDKGVCLEFKVSLYEELGKEEYSELFRAVLLLLLSQKNRYDKTVYEQLNQKLNEVNLKVDKLNQKLNVIQKYNVDTIVFNNDSKYQNNKKQKYIDKFVIAKNVKKY